MMPDSHPLDGVAVDVYSTSGTDVGGTTTGSNGTYSVIGLSTGSYDVCFGVSTYEEPTGGTSATGYLDQCYKRRDVGRNVIRHHRSDRCGG